MELLNECLSTDYIVCDPNISECPGCAAVFAADLANPTRTVGIAVGLGTIVEEMKMLFVLLLGIPEF